MKKRIYSRALTLLVVMVCAAQGAYAQYVLGDRVAASQLKAGDKIILRNAACDRGAEDSWRDGGVGMYQLLNGNKTAKDWINGSNDVLAVEVPPNNESLSGPIAADYIFELVAAGNGPTTGNPMYYLKNLANNRYVKGSSMYGQGSQISVTDDIGQATPFEPDSAAKYCTWYADEGAEGWAFTTTQIDETTSVMKYTYNPDDPDYGIDFLGAFWNYGRSHIMYWTKDCIVWNIHYAKQDNSFEAKFKELYATVNTEAQSAYHPGVNPGDVDEGAFGDLLDALDEAAAYTEGTHTEAEYEEQYNSIKSAYDAVNASTVAFTDGYYNIVSAYPQFQAKQGVEKAMSSDGNHHLTWATLNTNDPMQLFKITSLGDNKYTVQNVSTKEYINRSRETTMGGQVMTGATSETDQWAALWGHTGQWLFANTAVTIAYNIAGHANGDGISGNIITWNDGVNSPSAWYFRRVTDEELINRLINQGEQRAIQEALNGKLAEAATAMAKAIDHDRLVTDAAQFSSNNSSDDDHSSFEHLIDGLTDYNHNFHSIWNNGMAEGSTTLDVWKTVLEDWTTDNPANIAVGTGYHNLQVRLNEPVSKFYFEYVNRTGTSYVDNPTDIEIYATNDDALGASTDQAEISQWTRITELTDGFPANTQGARYTSPNIDLGGSYKYIRFVVKKTSQMNNKASRSFMVPDITGVTWNVGEFQLYAGDISATSEYNTVAGMKEAYDNLAAVVADVEAKIAASAAQYSDTTALISAIKAVNDLYVDRQALKAELDKTVAQAQTLYTDLRNTNVKLITRPLQFSSNSNDYTWSLSEFSNLIDGDAKTYFHTLWHPMMGEDTTTARGYEAFLEEFNARDDKNSMVGTGYHNLQVKFDAGVSKFYFTYTGRDEDVWHDNPNDIVIYATNDDALGATPDNANEGSWTKITELTEGFPENVRLAQYTSPVIDMEQPYKYVRFVVKNTTNVDQAADRTFKKPDLTGITWNICEFQAYLSVDDQNLQYNYDADFKAAADKMKALADSCGALYYTALASNAANEELAELMARVNAMKVTTGELETSYTIYNKMATTTSVGSNIGEADTRAAIDEFKNAIDAAYAAGNTVAPTKSQIESAQKAMDDAYTAFLAHLKTVEPGKWYNFTSGYEYEGYINQPITISNTSTGAILNFGNYPDDKAVTSDPMATWRFVPIEGKEGQYAIQSLATGQYFGDVNGDGSPLMTHEKVPYLVVYYGNGNFRLRQASMTNRLNSLRADLAAKMVVNAEALGDDQQSWKIAEADGGLMEFTNFRNNTVQIVTLPFATKGEGAISSLNGFAKTYAVKALSKNEGDLNLVLKEQTDFEAGEPMILVIGKPDETSHDAVTLTTDRPDDVVDTSTVVSNGLVGTLAGTTLSTEGMGYFLNSRLLATGLASIGINGLAGYINPRLVVNEEGEGDLTINANSMAVSIHSAKTAKTAGKVNVYSIDGTLLKKDADTATAKDGLAKGIYIIGKKKVIVK